MVYINTILCLLGLASQALASPIGIYHRHGVLIIDLERRSTGSGVAAAFGAPARRSPHDSTSSSSSQSTTSAWHYNPTVSIAPTTSTSNAAAMASVASSDSGVSLNGASVPSFDSSKPFGLAYSPYTSSGGCKDVSAIASDLQSIEAAGYQSIRLYGVDCNQVPNVLSAMAQIGCNMKLMLGVFDLSTATSQASQIISAMNGDWSKVITVSVGNEPVNNGLASPATVVSTTSAVRSQLRAYFPLHLNEANFSAGYTGPVVAVDTFIAILNNPTLCDASDYIAANAHAYFDGNVAASGAGAWVAQQAQKLSSLCGKDVLITESGWPSAGNSNGAAVPSKSNQQTAVSSILGSMGNKCVMFSAFNDAWKSPGSYGVEQYWVFSCVCS